MNFLNDGFPFYEDITDLNETVNDDRDKCKSCKSGELEQDICTGELICRSCGCVMQELVEEVVGYKEIMDEGGCFAQSNNSVFPASSRQLIRPSNANLARCLTTVPYPEKSFARVCARISTVCEQNNILVIVKDCACMLYYKVSEKRHLDGKNEGKKLIVRGNNRQGLIANCLHVACAKLGCPRTLDEIKKYFDLGAGTLNKGRKSYEKWSDPANNKTPDAYDIITRQAKKLSLMYLHVDECLGLYLKVKVSNALSSHTIMPIAGACIYYIICKYETFYPGYDLQKVGIEFSVTKTTLERVYRKLEYLVKNNLLKYEEEDGVKETTKLAISVEAYASFLSWGVDMERFTPSKDITAFSKDKQKSNNEVGRPRKTKINFQKEFNAVLSKMAKEEEKFVNNFDLDAAKKLISTRDRFYKLSTKFIKSKELEKLD